MGERGSRLHLDLDGAADIGTPTRVEKMEERRAEEGCRQRTDLGKET